MTFPEWMEQQRKENGVGYDQESPKAERPEYDFEAASRRWVAARLEANECAARSQEATNALVKSEERERECWALLLRAAGRDTLQSIGGSGKHPGPR